jgi:glycosyltransferase involved in cell wall biosynthesis
MRKIKFAAITPTYNDEATISGTIKCLAPFVDKHIVLISEKPYFGEDSLPDRTEEICNELDCEIIKSNWKLDHFQRNTGLQTLKEYDWVFTFDSDEMMEYSEIERLIRFTEKCTTPAIGVTPEVYWHDIDHVFSPRSEFQPIIMVKPNVKFSYIRNIDSPYICSSVDMHHLSWCAPKDIYKKVTNYAHASDFDGKKWYKENYENWDLNSGKAVLPTGVYTVIKKSLPEELRKLL